MRKEPMFVTVKNFNFFEPKPRGGAKIRHFEVGQEVPAQTVKTRRLVQKGFVKAIQVGG